MFDYPWCLAPTYHNIGLCEPREALAPAAATPTISQGGLSRDRSVFCWAPFCRFVWVCIGLCSDSYQLMVVLLEKSSFADVPQSLGRTA